MVWGTGLQAQDERKFRLYSSADGLSDNNISGIEQDSKGYLWIGTSRGLNRYDGKNFVQYHAGKNFNYLPDEVVTGLSWIGKNRLAVFTGLGIHIINMETGQSSDLIVPFSDAKYLYKFNAIMSALSDDKGNIIMLTRSGLYQFDSLQNLKFRFDYYRKEEIETEYFAYGNNLFWIAPNTALVTTKDGLYIYDSQNYQLKKIDANDSNFSELYAFPHDKYLIRQFNASNFLIIKDGVDSLINIDVVHHRRVSVPYPMGKPTDEFGWRSNLIGVNDSLFYFTSQEKGFFHLHLDLLSGKIAMDTVRRFPGFFCRDFIQDFHKRLWVATSAGLMKESTGFNSVAQAAIPKELLMQNPDAKIRAIVAVKNKLYVACVRNGGLLLYDKASLGFQKKISLKKFGPGADIIFSIFSIGGDTLYLGTNGPVCWLNTTTGETGLVELKDYDRTFNWVSFMFKDRKGNDWIMTNEVSKAYERVFGESHFRALRLDTTVFKKIMVPNNMAEDSSGNLWVSGQGVCRINRKTGLPDFYMDSFPYIRYPRREVTSMALDKNQILWLGINNNGLAGYDTRNRSFLHFTTQEGLPDNYIASLYPLSNKLWIGTATGIACMDLLTHKISKFSSDDGFAPLPLTGSSFFYDSLKKQFYCGFTDRVTRFNPDSLMFAQSPPAFFFDHIRFLNDSIIYHPWAKITIPYNNNDMAITLGSINYNDVSNQRIVFRILNSGDTSWKSLSGDQINFNNLSPGEYRLQAKLFAANDRWPAQLQELQILVKPPYWRTAWFMGLLGLVLVGGVFGVYRFNVNEVKKRERARSQLQELKAEEYRNRLELEKISNYFSSSMSDKSNTDEILWDVARNLIGRIGYTDCMIYLWNEDKTKMVQKAGYGPKSTPEDLAGHIFDVAPGQGVVGYVMNTKKPVLIPDTRKDNRYRPDDIFRLSEIAVPIIHNDELMGVLDSEHEEPHFYRERDLKILTTIATLVGNKIKQVESENSLANKSEELATINEQLAEAQLKALQTQMNPHFIFNALNSIKRMILDNENRNASRYLSKFAQMIRLTLNHSKETFVTLEETIEYLNAYLEMEQLRFGSSFTYQILVSGKADEEDINIPTLMIQPLVENAIWHGLMHREGEKVIVIRFEISDDWVSCSIQDNGIGIRNSEKMNRGNRPPSVGLDNLRNRIKIMNEKYSTHCTLAIEDLGEIGSGQSGTFVLLKFKIITDKRIIA